MKITNISPGPRGIHTEDGLRIIAPGASIEAEVSAVELEGAKATGWFDLDSKPKAKGDKPDAKEA